MEEGLHVGDGVDGNTDAADLALRLWRIGVVPHLRWQVEGDRESRLPLLQQVAVALVGFARRREAGVLAHRPEAAAVHRLLHAARVREGAWCTDLCGGVAGWVRTVVRLEGCA